MYRCLVFIITFAFSAAVCAGASDSQEGKLMVLVKPDHAYIFVDDKPLGDGSRLIRLPAGTHTVAAYNYGYAPQSREVSVQPGKNPKIEFKLQRVAARNVVGPQGRIQIEGASRAAVFLNGKSPGYFVGHGDEFNNNVFSWQQLMVPAGTYELTIMDRDREIWSGPVTVTPHQRVIVDVANNGQQKVKKWHEGEESKSFPRSKTDIFGNTTVAVAPVSGQFKAEQTKLNCGDSTRLVWSSAETVEAQISDGSEHTQALPPSGDLAARPTKTTTYAFRATGPGGVVESQAPVEVNSTVQANLEASPPEIRYRKIGDKVVQHDSSTLAWNSSNSDSITLDPGGIVTATGDQAVQPAPEQTAEGPVDETVTYTLVAKNECGGSATRTATIHMIGSIEPIPNVLLASVFFPTGYPDRRHPDAGLVRSQQLALSEAAKGFLAYLEYDPDARMQIVGYADERDSRVLNQALSQRRVTRVQQYLIAAGIPSKKIDVAAYGKDWPLSAATVKSLEQENPNQRLLRNRRATVWAYNRRVDLVMVPKGAPPVQSVRFFPHNVSEAVLLYSPAGQNLRAVEKAQNSGATRTTTSLNSVPTGHP